MSIVLQCRIAVTVSLERVAVAKERSGACGLQERVRAEITNSQ